MLNPALSCLGGVLECIRPIKCVSSSILIVIVIVIVYTTYQMRIVPEFLLPQPHHHLGNMYQYSNHVIYTKLQHCDTLSAVFAHVASHLATTDSHRLTQAARAAVNMSDN